MATRRTSPQNEPLAPPKLTVSRQEAESKLQARIDEGKKLLLSPINTESDLENNSDLYHRWSKFNSELLTRIFDNAKYQADYDRWYGGVFGGEYNFQDKVSDLQRDIKEKLERLRSLQDRLPIIDEAPSINVIEKTFTQMPAAEASAVNATNVFLVHGHDEAARETVARFVEKLGLKPIILHEQPNLGQTVMEKLEKHGQVAFAVVMLTPDDVGAAKDDAGNLRPRARQNVVLELGYFFGLLGRGHVAAMHYGNLELPSDISGIVYIPFDSAGAWKLILAREMRAAGLDVDMNKAI